MEKVYTFNDFTIETKLNLDNPKLPRLAFIKRNLDNSFISATPQWNWSKEFGSYYTFTKNYFMYFSIRKIDNNKLAIYFTGCNVNTRQHLWKRVEVNIEDLGIDFNSVCINYETNEDEIKIFFNEICVYSICCDDILESKLEVPWNHICDSICDLF